MSAIEFENMSIKEIQELQNKAVKHIESRKKMNIVKVRKAIRQMIKDEGLKLSDVFPTLQDEPMISTVDPKYRSPDDETLTWTGRGRTPKWLQEKINEGASKEDFLIDQ